MAEIRQAKKNAARLKDISKDVSEEIKIYIETIFHDLSTDFNVTGIFMIK